MDLDTAIQLVKRERNFLMNILKDFKPEHSDYKPQKEMKTVGQQIRHIELTIKFHYYSTFGPGFDMSFQEYLAEMKKPISLEKALQGLHRMYDEAIAMLEKTTAEELLADLPNNPMLGTGACYTVIYKNSEHTAHHRGALSVYLRMLGITPAMVYSV
jgi:uncharacterized damage-inducible protein DinB